MKKLKNFFIDLILYSFYPVATELTLYSRPVNVTIWSLPDVDLGADRQICPGEQTTLDAGTGFTSYEWSVPDSTNQTIHGTDATFWVKVTVIYGYTSLDTILADLLPPPSLSLGNDTVICLGGTMILDAGAGVPGIQWSNDSTTRTIEVTNVGNYWVMVTDDNGCMATDFIPISEAEVPQVSISVNHSQGDPVSPCEY